MMNDTPLKEIVGAMKKNEEGERREKWGRVGKEKNWEEQQEVVSAQALRVKPPITSWCYFTQSDCHLQILPVFTQASPV